MDERERGLSLNVSLLKGSLSLLSTRGPIRTIGEAIRSFPHNPKELKK